ncbi:MAG: hypothetical protein WCR54_03020 [Clostridia bacterium]
MKTVNKKDAKDFDNPYKIALVALLDDKKDIHITLMSTLMNKGDNKMMIGEFVIGDSKKFIYQNPNTGFLIMNTNKEFWTGKMKFTHFVIDGDDYVHYNKMPLYRFNTYFGVNKVHYADLIDISERTKLDMGGVIGNAIKVSMFKGIMAGDKSKKILRPWAQKFLAKLDGLMYIAYIGEDGFPKIVPIIQGQSASSSRIVFTNKPYKNMLSDLKENMRVAIYGMSLKMEAVLVKGFYHKAIGDFGYVDIDTVYNPLPPKHGYVYPEIKQTAVEFDKE